MKQTRMSKAVDQMKQLVALGVDYEVALQSTASEFEMSFLEVEVLEFKYDTYVDVKD